MSVARDPVSGPIPREEFRALVSAPHGTALKTIRKYDPLFGRAAGEKIKWRVCAERQVTEEGLAEVEAASKEEAEKLASNLPDSAFSWDCDDFGNDAEIISVEPVG